jgi:hypothetical protein
MAPSGFANMAKACSPSSDLSRVRYRNAATPLAMLLRAPELEIKLVIIPQ